MHISKNKVIFLIITFLLAVAMTISGISLAVMLKNTENRANNFTFGNVKIVLEEPEWEEESKIVYPNKSVKKDPQITNTGENNLYAYIEVKIPKRNVRTVSADGKTINEPSMHDLLTIDKIEDGWTKIKDINTEKDYHILLYAYTADVLKSGETTPPLFKSVTFLNVVEGEPEGETKFDMPISAYAIQSGYISGTSQTNEDIMKTAFEKYLKS